MAPPPPEPPDDQVLLPCFKEMELSQERRDFISSLPIEKSWTTRGYLHNYQGFWFLTMGMQGVLAFQKHFQAHDTDVLLTSSPKAGTTWSKAMLFALLNRVRHPSPQGHPLVTNNPHTLVLTMELTLYYRNQVPDLTFFPTPRLFATHLPYAVLPASAKDSACKIVYVCRNPKDTFVSLWLFVNRAWSTRSIIGSLDEAFDMFARGVSPFGPYWDHVLGYWKKSQENPQKVLFLKYEDMKKQPTSNLRRLADFVGCPFSPEEEAKGIVNDISTLCSFDNLKNQEVNKNGKGMFSEANEAYFRRGEIGDCVNYLTEEMIEKLDRITDEKFHGSGLKF
ncbi:Cytosolic sulfotransferase 5 [Morella rubra]|uniref:Sulfotransferase n=1 Tax=Morella rubra TaxID=262757 RepID=A0A6A1V296_9ROSI|nr:Cytosolic sulfotransferase 5 [Morella rubra]